MPARPTVSERRRDEIMTAAKKVAGLPFDVVYQYFDSKDAYSLR
jgi:hypothetical protein